MKMVIIHQKNYQQLKRKIIDAENSNNSIVSDDEDITTNNKMDVEEVEMDENDAMMMLSLIHI